MTDTSSIPLSALELSAAIRARLPYDASRLDRVLRVDERHGLVEVQASTPWKALAASLRPGDPRAARTQTTVSTVGESLAHNAAGPDGRFASATAVFIQMAGDHMAATYGRLLEGEGHPA